jgi:hypothetical protein
MESALLFVSGSSHHEILQSSKCHLLPSPDFGGTSNNYGSIFSRRLYLHGDRSSSMGRPPDTR